MYCLQLDDESENGNNSVFYQCIFCRNALNFEERVSELEDKAEERKELEREGLLHEDDYLQKLQEIDKSHILSSKGYAQLQANTSDIDRTYNPQVNDFVFYFW